jgi:hypothetical protein
MRLIPAPSSLTYPGMKKRFLLLLACCAGLSAGLSCTTRKVPSSPPASPPGQAAADAEASNDAVAAANLRREQDESLAAAEAKAKKIQDAATAKALKKAQAEAARQAKSPQSATPAATATKALSAKEQKLNDLNSRYINGQITPEEYHTERAKIVAEPDAPDAPAPAK